MGKKLSFLFVVVFFLGCVPMGRDFPTVPIKDIQANVTTKNQIFSAFGEPIERGYDTGDETWTYYHYVLTVGGVQTQKRLYIVFNKDGTVRNYSYSTR
ncbi:MAG: outer membrane protein assembly factor BamE domain-containing protein [Candidatus Binatia bacterium]